MKKKLVMSVELTVDVNDGRKSLILHTNSIQVYAPQNVGAPQNVEFY